MATFDAILSSLARHFVDRLTDEQHKAFTAALDVLCSNPYEDGDTKTALNFYPYQPGTYAFQYGEFVLTYYFVNNATLGIAQVGWHPGSPNFRPQTTL